MPLPKDLQSVADALVANETAAHQVVDGLSQQQLDSTPTGGWSILQCLDHITLANLAYSTRMKDSLAQAKPSAWKPIAPTLFGRLFISRHEPPVTMKVSAPRKIVPGAGKTRDQILRAFEESHVTIRSLLTDARELDVNAVKFRNPFVPLLRVRFGTGLLIMAAHERRHLWQADRVRASILKSA